MFLNYPLISFLFKNLQRISPVVLYLTAMCILQNRNSRRTIGRAIEWNGLYIENPNLSTKSHSLVTKSAMTDKEKIHLHHCRMGHPSFQIVKTIFPSLFENIDIRSMCCEVCELAKHRLLPFPINNKLLINLFLLFILMSGVLRIFQLFQVLNGF